MCIRAHHEKDGRRTCFSFALIWLYDWPISSRTVVMDVVRKNSLMLESAIHEERDDRTIYTVHTHKKIENMDFIYDSHRTMAIVAQLHPKDSPKKLLIHFSSLLLLHALVNTDVCTRFYYPFSCRPTTLSQEPIYTLQSKPCWPYVAISDESNPRICSQLFFFFFSVRFSSKHCVINLNRFFFLMKEDFHRLWDYFNGGKKRDFL